MGATAYTLTYDSENRLTGVSGGATATFVYDSDGNRVKATIAGTTTAYVGIYYELSGSVYKKYYYAGSQRVALNDNGTLKWLLGDHLGSTSITADGITGAFLTELRYKPWGDNRYTSGTTPTTYRFTGQRQEAALGGADGLYYYVARWYDPATSRFLQADSIVPDGDKASIVPLTVDFHEPQFLAQLNAENRYTLEHGFWFQLSTAEKREAKVQRGPLNPQDLNRYSYARNNPLRYTDSTGHNPLALLAAAAPIVIIVAAVIVAGYFYYEMFISPNAAENRDGFESNLYAIGAGIEVAGEQVAIGINAVFSGRGRYAGDPRTAGEIISDEKQGNIMGKFPSEWLNKTYDEIKKAADAGDKAAQTAKKLLDRKEYDKNKKK